MQTITDWQGLDPALKGASVAMGNFDGVHLGHRSVIALAAAKPEPLGIVTFEPHPRAFFTPKAAQFRLMNSEARRHRLAKLGVERLYELHFDEVLAAMSAEDFAQQVLCAGLGVRHVAVGADFRFGKGRTGTAELLTELGAACGFDVSIAPLLRVDGLDVSSTAIRQALSDGRPRDAAAMLGHWHRIEGAVEHGEKRGREMGYPTANMGLSGLHLPRMGVYAVRVEVLGGPQAGEYDGVASLGVRPMFGRNAPNLETYIFDFSGDLYDQHLSVALVDYLRPEIKFASLEALVTQIEADCGAARSCLSAL
ncbi:bifunctional riboflavin kinase/FAD synthetase [Phaeovulum sp.]|uniref:bifunctional riboflavin kinase/FAD synthetase n=1 Tax=Phaeovulum sp. TaxID=2934796 RepID=UPI0035657B49